MSRIIRLTENDLARIVRRVIMEEPSLPQPLTLPNPLKTVVYKDKAATKVETNIDVDSLSIELAGNDVKFEFTEAGFTGDKYNGYFNCSSSNKVRLSADGGVRYTGDLYLSNKRSWIFKSKCGKAQGYVNTNTVVDTNLS